LPRKEAAFIEPMECLSVSKLPEGSQWLWEIKLDGYRALAVKFGSDVTLDSVFPKLRFFNETDAGRARVSWRRLKPTFSQRSQCGYKRVLADLHETG
jgi:hypothetical protein